MSNSQKEDFKQIEKEIESMYAEIIDHLKATEIKTEDEGHFFEYKYYIVRAEMLKLLAPLMIVELVKELKTGENNKKLRISRKDYQTELEETGHSSKLYHKLTIRACWI